MPNESLNKFQSAVTRTTAAIGVKTSVFVGSAKIKTHISTLKNEITALKKDLGAEVYGLWEKGESSSEQVTRLCQAIKEKYDNIAELEAEIDKLERQETEVLGGRKPEENTAPPKTEAYICPNCSMAFNDPVKFCRKCGTKMS